MTITDRLAGLLHRMGRAVFRESWATQDLGVPPTQPPSAMAASPGVGTRPGPFETAWSPAIPDYNQINAVNWCRAIAAGGVPYSLVNIFQAHTVGDVFEVRLKAKDPKDEARVDAANQLLQQWLLRVGLDRKMWASLCGTKVIDGSIPNYFLPGSAGPQFGLMNTALIEQYGVNLLRSIAWLDIPRSELDLDLYSTRSVRQQVISEGQDFDTRDPDGICVRDVEHPEIHPLGVGVLAPLVLLSNRDERHQEAALRKAIASGSITEDVTVTATSGQSNKDAVAEAVEMLGTTLPPSGSVRVHSSNMEVNRQSPQMALYEHEASIRGTETRMASVAGISPTWLGIGVDVNRASAAEMGSPAERRMEMWRADFRAHVRAVTWAALYYMRAAGILLIPEDAYEIVVLMPDLAPTDTAALANTLAATLTTLDVMAGNDWLTSETAQAIALERLSHMTDVPLDAATEGTPGDRRQKEDDERREREQGGVEESRRMIREER